MKKSINIRMTYRAAHAHGIALGKNGTNTLLAAVEIDLDTMTPAGRWIAEHITSTYVVDEYRDKIGISATAGFSMMERDRRAWKSDEYVNRYARCFGDYYTTKPMKIDEITFPIYSNPDAIPESVIEATARELKQNGAVKLTARNGDEYTL